MGPFRMGDLAGNDIGWAIRKRRYVEKPDMRYSKTADLLCELGRFGQKTGAGWYDYVPGKRDAIPSRAGQRHDRASTARSWASRRARSATTRSCIAWSTRWSTKARSIVEEGIALRASDIDMVYLTGYGFPLWRGGPMNYADTVGLFNVVAGDEALRDEPARRRRRSGSRAAARAAGGRRQDLQLIAPQPSSQGSQHTMTSAVIVSTARTPLAKSWKGAFNMTHGATLGGHAVKHAVERAGIDPAEVDDVIMGCATPEGATGGNIARQIALRAGLPITTSGMTVNRFCSSGLQTIAMAAQRIIAGEGDVYVAGGVESISCVQNEANKHMLADPWLVEHKPEIYWNMLQTAEQVAKRYKIARERMDEYGAASQQKATAARDAGSSRTRSRRSPCWPASPTRCWACAPRK